MSLRSLRIPAFVAGLALAWPGAPAPAEIYRWTDDQGRVHFTQHLEQVPAKYRRKAKERANRPRTRVLNRTDPSETRAAAPPAARARRAGDALEIPFEREGSLMRVEATLNDRLRVPFLVDTGASGVSIPSAYARELGLTRMRDQAYVRLQTANGVVSRPVFTLDAVQVGGARVEGLSATVNPSMTVGLLGGDFFNNFIYRVDAAAGVISLVPNENVRGGVSAEEWRQRFHAIRAPLARLDAHVRANPDLREAERAALEAHRAKLEAHLAELEREADRLDVPRIWRD